MSSRSSLVTGSLAGLIAVLLGAFGAHGLKASLSAKGLLDTYNLAVEYQFYHAFALLATGVLAIHLPSKKLSYAAVFFTAGIVLFSGSLYLLAVLNKTFLGAITPFGGLSFILGWLFLLLGVIGNKKGPAANAEP